MLRYVIPPLATITTDGSNNAVTAAGDLANLCYIYMYDKRQRMVVKKFPGADSVLMVYDLRDRLVATQDRVQRAKSPKECLFTKYDVLNRPILTGTIQSANTRVQMQTAVNAYSGTNLYETRTTSSTHHYYTQNSFPNSSFTKTYLTVTYYDDYDINNDGSGSGDPAYTTDSDFANNSAFSRLKNKVTVSKVRELDPSSSSEVWFTTADFYDKRYRILQTNTSGIQGGNNLVTHEINLEGWLVKNKENQTVFERKCYLEWQHLEYKVEKRKLGVGIKGIRVFLTRFTDSQHRNTSKENNSIKIICFIIKQISIILLHKSKIRGP